MRDTKNKFKVNLDMKDILVTEEQRLEFLRLHNKLKDTLDYISDCKDVTLSQVAMLEELMHHLHSSLKFAPQKDSETDRPSMWSDYVLESDETAWQRAY
tara:strand:- start:45 stop:341 length:297 start_codon:yes stop_codon:yes gene_type:complete